MVKRIITIESLKAKRALGNLQDGNRDWIPLLACICADGTALDPSLLFPGASGDMQDTWLQDFEASDSAYFGVSDNGWSNEEYGLRWLEIFNKVTKAKANLRGTSRGAQNKRLLILDGHSSHINMQFIDYADRNGILLSVLPPHSTHRLQPLDIEVFGPLSRAYSKHASEDLRDGFGFMSIKKTDFWQLFKAAWKDPLTPENIRAGYASAGIHLLDPNGVISQLNARPYTPPDQIANGNCEPVTPVTARGLSRLVHRLQAESTEPFTAGMKQLVRAMEKMPLAISVFST